MLHAKFQNPVLLSETPDQPPQLHISAQLSHVKLHRPSCHSYVSALPLLARPLARRWHWLLCVLL